MTRPALETEETHATELASIDTSVESLVGSAGSYFADPLTFMLNWRISPAQATRPDPNVAVAGNDMNTWGWGEPPMRQDPEASPFRLYRSEVNVRADAPFVVEDVR